MQSLEKNNVSRVIKKIESVSKDEISCVLLGTRGLIDWQDDGTYWNHEHGESCLEYAFSRISSLKMPFNALPGETSVNTRDFGNTDAVWYGNEDARTILRILEESGLQPYELFCPYTSDNQLLPHVCYSFASRSRPSQREAAPPALSEDSAGRANPEFRVEAVGGVAVELEAGPGGDDADLNVTLDNFEQLLPLLDNTGDEDRRFRITRSRDLVGRLRQSVKREVPAFETSTPENQEPLVWIFEVVIYDLASAAVLAIERLASENRSEESVSRLPLRELAHTSDCPSNAEAVVEGTGEPTQPTYRWPGQYEQDQWIYDNIADHTYEELEKKHDFQSKKTGWKLITSRNAFKSRSRRFATFHGFSHRGFA